jgi:hypothetical protein
VANISMVLLVKVLFSIIPSPPVLDLEILMALVQFLNWLFVIDISPLVECIPCKKLPSNLELVILT